jgi:GMP synthase PP-ATPase subunit
LRLLTK